MKTFRLISTMLLAMILLISCGGDDPTAPEKPTEPSITVPSGETDYFSKGMTFDSKQGEKNFTFETNSDWAISVASTRSGESWCSVSPTSGNAGKHTIRVKTEANTTYDDRQVTLTLAAGSTKKAITISQKQQDALTLTKDKFEVEAKGGTIEVEVKANINYDVIIPEESKSWISKSTRSRGLTTSNIAFDITESEELEKREGEIIIKSGKLSETIHVYQSGQKILLLSKNEFKVSAEGNTIQVELKSNLDYGVKMPQVDWVSELNDSRAASSHTLYFLIKENNTSVKRNAKIVIYDKNSEKEENIMITQTGGTIIENNKATVNLEEAGTLKKYISENVKYNIQELTIIGNINGDDIALIREMCGTNIYNDEDVRNGALYYLNLEDTQFVDGGIYRIWNHESFASEANIISEYMFSRCKSLQKIILPNNITEIKESAFLWCVQLKEINLNNNIQKLGKYCFQECRFLQEIQLPNKLTEIPDYSFSLTGLKSVSIPETVEVLGASAFRGSSNLLYVEMGSRIKEIDSSFIGCAETLEVHTKTKVAPYSNIYAFPIGDSKLYVPKGSYASYTTTFPWKSIRHIYEEE